MVQPREARLSGLRFRQKDSDTLISTRELSPIVGGHSFRKSLEYLGKLPGTLETTGERNLDDRFVGGAQ
jgi:hypothetical protein